MWAKKTERGLNNVTKKHTYANLLYYFVLFYNTNRNTNRNTWLDLFFVVVTCSPAPQDTKRIASDTQI